MLGRLLSSSCYPNHLQLHDDPSNPSNFRPIALTSCIGKIFTTVLQRRWLRFMLDNWFMDSSIQKAMLPAIPGCLEHHCKLAGLLADARHKHRSVAVCWLDLANAYGSVHHSLIDFTLKHYHAPDQFQLMVSALYTKLSAQISTQHWCTTAVPLQRGVYQGDPLSVVIFNTVINTLVDTLKTRRELGYTLSGTKYQINLLQYADDSCIVGDSPASVQHLLHTTDRWLTWAGMRAKPSKCFSLAIVTSSSKLIHPHLTITGDDIPFVGDKPFKFLGMEIQMSSDQQRAR